MRTKVLLLLLSLVSLGAYAQFEVKDVDSVNIHKAIKLKKNKVVSCVSWSDKNGENYVIETLTPLIIPKSAQDAKGKYELVKTNGHFVNSKKVNGKTVRGEYVGGKTDTIWAVEAEYRVKGIFTYHYLIDKKDTLRTIFKNIDQVSECSYKYLQANYLCKPIVTDLDKDGVAEVWFIYQMGCRDNSNTPLVMKLALYIGKDCYMLKGTRIIHDGEKVIGGEVKPDKSFESLSQAYRDFALTLWGKYVTEK